MNRNYTHTQTLFGIISRVTSADDRNSSGTSEMASPHTHIYTVLCCMYQVRPHIYELHTPHRIPSWVLNMSRKHTHIHSEQTYYYTYYHMRVDYTMANSMRMCRR